MKSQKHSIRKIETLFVMVAILFFACQQNKSDVKVSVAQSELLGGQKFNLKAELFSEGKTVEAKQADFSYQCKFGRVENDVYYAPDAPGEEIIQVIHNPTRQKHEIRFRILARPQLFVAIGPVLNCQERFEIVPVLKIGSEEKKIDPLECRYESQKGRFEKNVYLAPASECEDTIQVYFPSRGLETKAVVKVDSKPILKAEIQPKKMIVNQQASLDIYWSKSGQRLESGSSDYRIQAGKGKVEGKIYYAPAEPGTDVVTISSMDFKIELPVEIMSDTKLEVTIPKEELICYEEMPVTAKLHQGGKEIELIHSTLKFDSLKGKFNKNVYTAAEEEGEDTLTITHTPSGQTKSFSIKIKYSKYRPVHTDRFSLEIPSDWIVESSEIGFRAKARKLSHEKGIEVTVAVFPGLDFLDTQTLKLFSQQQKGAHKGLEESSEKEIEIGGSKGIRVAFENFSDGKKAWWILVKKDKSAYILTFNGPNTFFDVADSIPQHMVDTFRFKPSAKKGESILKMASKTKKVATNLFSVEIPEDWDLKNIGGSLCIGTSRAHYNGDCATLFVMSYQQNEVQNLDISLILVLFRQEMVKDPSMKDIGERDIQMAHGVGKVVEFEGGTTTSQRMWIVASKYNITAYGILFLAPLKLWEENPSFADDIIKTFEPKK